RRCRSRPRRAGPPWCSTGRHRGRGGRGTCPSGSLRPAPYIGAVSKKRVPCSQAASTVASASWSGMSRNMLPNGAVPKPSGPLTTKSLILIGNLLCGACGVTVGNGRRADGALRRLAERESVEDPHVGGVLDEIADPGADLRVRRTCGVALQICRCSPLFHNEDGLTVGVQGEQFTSRLLVHERHNAGVYVDNLL